MTVEPTDTGHQSIIYNGFYELSLSRKMLELAKKGTILFDVGANYGYFSLLWAAAQPANIVHAFEPAPKNFIALQNNVQINNLNKQVHCSSRALSNENGTVSFSLESSTGQTGWGGITLAESKSDIKVDTITLDQYCQDNHIAHIDVLKIDTEGADPLVLQGADMMLTNKAISHIFFEINARMKDLGIDDYYYPVKLLTAKGYKIAKVGGGVYAFV